MNKNVLFTNWSDEDFSYTYANEAYDFPAGKQVYLPDYLAHHFAKHLANRELHKRGGTYDTYTSQFQHPIFQEYFNKSLGEPIPVSSEIKAEVEAANTEVSSDIAPKTKKVSKKKVEPKVEEEFEGLTE